jgi:hypothetical protein
MIVSMIACSLAWSVTPALLVMDEGERRRLDEQPLLTCPGAIHKFSEMSSSCGDTRDDAQVPRTPTTCASDACAGVVASMTDAALQDMIVGAGKCTGELAQYKTFFTEDYLKRAVLGTASECGLTSPLIADVCSKANEGSPCGSIYSGKTCQCTGRRRSRNLLFGTIRGASCWCA